MEACGNSQWFIELLERLGHQVWIGDAAEIRASYVRKQKTDRRDAYRWPPSQSWKLHSPSNNLPAGSLFGPQQQKSG